MGFIGIGSVQVLVSLATFRGCGSEKRLKAKGTEARREPQTSDANASLPIAGMVVSPIFDCAIFDFLHVHSFWVSFVELLYLKHIWSISGYA